MRKSDFNAGWIFNTGTGSSLESVQGGAGQSLVVTLPHDAAIGMPRDPALTMGPGVGFFPYDNLVYTKEFTLDGQPAGAVCWLEFEGVYMNAAVYVNGAYAGKCPNGYSNFRIDATRHVWFGQKNTVKVIVKNGIASGRWYTGGGIYRNVSLMVGPLFHILPDGVKISTPDVADDFATVRVTTALHNRSASTADAVIRHTLLDAMSKKVGEITAPLTVFDGEAKYLQLQLTVDDPALWSVDTPNLYTCHTVLTVDGVVVDEEANRFGIRRLQLDTKHGLRINGQTVKLRGGCIHHDHGVIGAAEFKNATLRRVRKLKQAGYNAVRMSHHPASRALLDACDELGMLVMDELTDCWTSAKVAFDYGFHFSEWWERDVTSMVERDYNHPSVILYSIGNEIPETGNKIDVQWGKKLADKMRQLDATRYTVNCVNLMLSAMSNTSQVMADLAAESNEPLEINSLMNNMMEFGARVIRSEAAGKLTAECFAQVDVAGYNYATVRYEQDIAAYPHRLIVGSETFSPQLDTNWALVEKYPQLLGDFNWTACDYLGEVGIGGVEYGEPASTGFYKDYPWKSAYCGDLDLIGDRRPISYWRDIVWGTRNQPYIAVQDPAHYGQVQSTTRWGWSDALESWTWCGYEEKSVVVEVYAAADEVELLLNGKPLERKAVGVEKACVVKFDTVYRPGTLEAVAYRNGAEIGRYSLQTAGEDVRLQLTCESTMLAADSSDIAFIEISVVDAKGVLNPWQAVKLTADVSGQGTLLGFGTANPHSEEDYFTGTANTFHGRALLVVRPIGKLGGINIIVSSDNAGQANLSLKVGKRYE